MLDNKDKKWIESTLRKLHFVKWDRLICEEFKINIFGWISRKDNYKDFVDIEFDLIQKKIYLIATSSAKYAQKIAEILSVEQVTYYKAIDFFDIY